MLRAGIRAQHDNRYFVKETLTAGKPTGVRQSGRVGLAEDNADGVAGDQQFFVGGDGVGR